MAFDALQSLDDGIPYKSLWVYSRLLRADNTQRMTMLSYVSVLIVLSAVAEALPMQITINQRQSECMYDRLDGG